MGARLLDALTFLLYNAAILVSMGFLAHLVGTYVSPRRSTRHDLRTGFFLGLITLAVMLTPWEYMPGILLDTRSIVLSLAGLFFGVVPALVAAFMATALRVYIGGTGMWAGIGLILSSALIGVLWRRWRPKDPVERSLRELYAFGVVVHINMLLWAFALPMPLALDVLQLITIPVMTIFPLTTVLFGWVIVTNEKQRRVEEALRLSEERYRRLFERVPIGLYRSTPDGRILEANPALARLYGFSSVEDLLKVNAFDLYTDPEERRRWLGALKDQDVVRHYELRQRRADGRIIWVRDTARAVRDEQGNILYYEGSIEDITALKEAEEQRHQLLQQAQRRATYLSALNEIITTAATATNEIALLKSTQEQIQRTLKVSYVLIQIEELTVNTQAPAPICDVLRDAAQEALQHLNDVLAVADWAHPPPEDTWVALAPRLRRHGLQASLFVPIRGQRHAPGVMVVASTHPRRWSEEVQALLHAVAHHLSTAYERIRMFGEAQRRAERIGLLATLTEALNRPSKVEDVIQAIGEGALRLSQADRVALFVRQRDDSFACVWRHNISVWYTDAVLANLDKLPGRSLLTRTEVVFIHDTYHWPEDSTLRSLADREGYRALAVWPLIYEGRTIAAVGCYYNQPHTWSPLEKEVMATFSRQAAVALRNAQLLEDLEQTNEQLRQALKAREDMLRNVTHELRTPLTLIRGYAELLQDDLLTQEEEKQLAAQAIYQHARHLEHLIEQLLTFQRLQRDFKHQEVIDVAKWLRKVLGSWSHALEQANLTLQQEIPPYVGKIRGHPDFLNQVMYNLLDNARKFSPHGGTVTVRAWMEEEFVYIQVADQGIGIPAEKLPHIFERFYQVDPSTTRRFGGMGLGLALVKEIIERHGGHVWAESEGPGRGTRLTFRLPLVSQ